MIENYALGVQGRMERGKHQEKCKTVMIINMRMTYENTLLLTYTTVQDIL